MRKKEDSVFENSFSSKDLAEVLQIELSLAEEMLKKEGKEYLTYNEIIIIMHDYLRYSSDRGLAEAKLLAILVKKKSH